jgi:hypothetical protein
MSPRTQAIGVVAIVLALFLIIELVRRRRLRTGYSLLWLFIGLVVLVLALWTDLVEFLSQLLGVRSPGSMLFAAGILFSLLILLEHSLALSTLWHDNKCLTQEVALLEWRVGQLEASLDGSQHDPLARARTHSHSVTDVPSGSEEEIRERAK